MTDPTPSAGEIQAIIEKVELCRPVSEQLKRMSKYDGKQFTWPTEKGDCTADDYAEWMYEDVAPALIRYIRQLEFENNARRITLDQIEQRNAVLLKEHREMRDAIEAARDWTEGVAPEASDILDKALSSLSV
jgi:hypothetical protein